MNTDLAFTWEYSNINNHEKPESELAMNRESKDRKDEMFLVGREGFLRFPYMT
jgi:hypothetical protein